MAGEIPNAIVLLDELTRGHADAWNILMPVLDETRWAATLSPDGKLDTA